MPKRLVAALLLALLALLPCAASAQTLRAKFAEGKAALAAGDPARAAQLFEEIVAKKRAPAVLFDLGLAYAKMGDAERARNVWLEILSPPEGAVVARPLSLVTMMKLAALLFKMKQPDQAMVWWQKALEIDPTNEQARLYIGLALYKNDQAKAAAKEWLLLIKSRPSKPVALKAFFYLGMAFVKLGDKAKAIKVFTKLVGVDPTHEKAKAALAKLQQGDEVAPPPPTEPIKDSTPAIEAQPTTPPPTGPDYPPVTGGEPPPPMPPTGPIAGPITEPPGGLQAEELFLDGLDQKEKGNYEKALFSFLQSLDVDPKFTQVYLQVGEVYLHLARLAPTEAQFKERVTLALQSLEKVGVLAPNTLLAHSAQGKIVQGRKVEKQGFAKYHQEIADTALKEAREQDAFVEYILLLSNKHLDDQVFLALATILPKLNQGNRQDLQFLLEDLSGKNVNHPLVPYVLAMTYLKSGKPAEGKVAAGAFLERLAKMDPKDPSWEAYRIHATYSKADPIDRYFLGSIHFARQQMPEAERWLREYVQKAKPDSPFVQEAARKLGQIGRATPSRESGFLSEVKELTAGVPASQVLFSDLVERSHADEKLLEDLRTFVQAHPSNGVARFAMAWVLSVRAEKSQPPTSGQYMKQSEDLFLSLLREKWPDSEWHFQVGLRGLEWGLEDRARSHLKTSGDILLSQGRVHSGQHARQALEHARKFLARGKASPATLLVKQSLVYDSDSLLYHLVKYELDASTGHMFSALWNLVECASKALASPWSRMILLTDVGLLISGVLMLALFGAALGLTIKYFDPLHHFFAEYLQSKGLVFSLPLFVVLTLLVLPTGFLLVFPLLVWSLMSRIEKQVYLLLIGLLLIVPLALPISFEGNFELIRMAEEFRSGNLEGTRPFFEEAVKRNEYDYVARYILGQIYLRQHRLEPAEQQFTRLLDQDQHDVGALVNLAVVKAKKGDTKKASGLLTQALGRAPADLPALFDLAAISQHAGDLDSAQKYTRWASGVAREGDQLQRYQAFYSDVPQLVLMDHPIDPAKLSGMFSFFSTSNFFAFNAPVLAVFTWLLAGGGLLAWLILLWQKLDFVLTRCAQCQRTVCNHCLRSNAGKSFCTDCAETELDREKLKAAAAGAAGQIKMRRVKHAFAANLLVPGAGLYFADLAPIAAFIECVFFFFFLLWWRRGGTLMNAIYQVPDLPVVNLFLFFCLALALGIYALAQGAFRQVKDEIPGP